MLSMSSGELQVPGLARGHCRRRGGDDCVHRVGEVTARKHEQHQGERAHSLGAGQLLRPQCKMVKPLSVRCYSPGRDLSSKVDIYGLRGLK